MRWINILIISLLFVGLFVSGSFAQSAEQTDWSGGSGEYGPVTSWGTSWWEGDVEYRSKPGEVFLPGDVITPIAHSVTTAALLTLTAGADIDGDGDDDIVLFDDTTDVLSWYENVNGDGSSWGSPVTLGTGMVLLDLVVADMDGVNGPDVIGLTSNDIYLWLNGGGGTSFSRSFVYTGFAGGADIKVGDIDGDGDLDVFCCSQVTDWYENANGDASSWTKNNNYSFAGYSLGADLGDFDGDGDLDVVVIDMPGNDTGWHENSDGVGDNWISHPVIDSAKLTYEVLAADMDGDGDPDVVACGLDGFGEVYWWENLDAYNNSWDTIDYIFQAGDDYAPQSLKVFDPDLDGDIDLLIAGFDADSLDWWENDGAVDPIWTKYNIIDTLSTPQSVTFGDFTHSQLLDVVACNLVNCTWYEIVEYAPIGVLQSSILDVGMTRHDWGVIDFNLHLPDTTSLVVEIRSSTDSANMGSWTSADDGQDLSDYVTDGERYFQYQLSLMTTDGHETPIFYDLTINWANPDAPTFDPTHSYLTTLTYNQINTITCGISGQAADEVTLYYLPGGDMGSWNTVLMTDDGGGIWSYALPWEDSFVSGLEYGFYAENADGSSWFPDGMPDSSYSLKIFTYFDSFTFNFSLPAGSSVSDYRLISTPFFFIGNDNGSPDYQFGDELGSYDPANWRLFAWNNSSGAYMEFDSSTDNFNLQAGDAWWIITKNGLSELTLTEVESILTGLDFGIAIDEGWNLIGSPYLFDVNWADCYTDIDDNTEEPLAWLNGDYATVTELVSKAGYWLWADAADTLYIPAQAVVSSSRQPDSITLTASPSTQKLGTNNLPELILPEVALSAEPALPLSSKLLSEAATTTAGWGDSESWQLAFQLANSTGSDSLHRLGVDPAAGSYDDSLERHDPPSLAGRPNLYFNHSSWPHGGGLYSTDLRTPYIDGATWQFYCDGEAEAVLSWSIENGWASDFIAIMETPSGRRIDLLAVEAINLTAAELASGLPCQVFVGTKDYVESELGGSPRLSLAQSYPNPATEMTRIEYALPTAGEVSLTVYDLAGRRVATLISGEQTAGRHAVGWECADIPAGVYLYRLETSEGTLTKRAVISR